VSSQQVYPEIDSWVAAIYATPVGGDPCGSGVVIDRSRILTCAHVVAQFGEAWVAFPRTDPKFTTRTRVASVTIPTEGQDEDIAILHLAEDVPAAVTPAPLRCPTLGRRPATARYGKLG
jgi:hypothetical protein